MDVAEIEGRAFDPLTPPACSGVSGFRLGETWVYFGKARDISKRLLSPRHRAYQIAKDLGAVMFYAPYPAVDIGHGRTVNVWVTCLHRQWQHPKRQC